MKPESRMQNTTLDPKSHHRDYARLDCRPISLLVFLEEENLRLRNVVIALSLDTMTLREALKTDQGPRSSPIC